MAISKIPAGYNTITPALTLSNAAEAIELYKKAFNAKDEGIVKMPGSDKIVHAVLSIGTSKLFINDPLPEMGPDCAQPSQTAFYLYMDDVDAAVAQAKKAGLEERMAPQDMFWGDRTGTVKDKFGIAWTLATHVRDVSEDDLKKGMKEFASKAA